jgi:hypothetical protein
MQALICVFFFLFSEDLEMLSWWNGVFIVALKTTILTTT